MNSFAILVLVAAFAGVCHGALEGVISCGSGANVVDIRVTSCTRVPCEAVVNNSYRIEVDFRASANHDLLHLQILLNHGGQGHPIFDAAVPDSAVEEGVTYTFGYTIQITGAFVGPANLAFRAFHPQAPRDEICFLIPFNIRP